MRGLGVEEAPGIEVHTLCTPSICEMAPMSGRAELQARIEQEMGLKVVGDEAVATLDATSLDRESCSTGPIIPVPKSALKRARKHRKNGVSLSGQGRGSSSTMSLSLEAWVEGLKGKLGHNEVQIQLIDEARQDAILFFEKSFEELGKGKFIRNADELALQAASLLLGKLQGKKEDELVSNASSMKINKVGRASSQCYAKVSDEVLVTDGVENDDYEDDYVEKGDEVEFSEKGSEVREKGEKQSDYAADEGDSGNNEEFAFDEVESPADDDEVGSADCGDGSASYEEEHLVGDSFSVYGDEAADVGGGEGDSAAGNDEEWADDEAEYSINDEHGNEGVEEEGEVDPTEGRDECGNEEWLDWLERGLRYVRGGNLMHEVLKEIHSYMRVVYDVQQQVFWEDESSIALKGCIILREIVRASPVRGLLHPESELGYQLLMNEEVIGVHGPDFEQEVNLRDDRADKMIWKPTGSDFTLKSAKDIMRHQGGRRSGGLWGGSLDDLIKLMLKDCVLWCMRMQYVNVVFESDDWRSLEEDEWRTCYAGVQIRANRCAERVNAVADCLLRSCPGLNIFFWRKEGLPRGLGRILALEGIPHFVFGPGVDSERGGDDLFIMRCVGGLRQHERPSNYLNGELGVMIKQG
nr:uncharacterized protein LOC109149028 [Ipomoea batatas]